MVKVLLNDLKLNRVWLFGVFLLLNLVLVLSSSIRTYPSRFGTLAIGLSFAMAMPLVVFLREEYYKGQFVYRSIPVSRAQVVMARYLSVCILGLLPALYGWSYQRIIEYLGPQASFWYHASQMESGYSIEQSLIARSIGLSVALAVVVPTIIRYGSVWRILLGCIGLLIVRNTVTEYLLDKSLHATFFLGMSRWVFFVGVFTIAIEALSIRLSIWLYDKREL